MTAQQLRDAYKNSDMAKLDRLQRERDLLNHHGHASSSPVFNESRPGANQPLRSQPFSTTIAAEPRRSLWTSTGGDSSTNGSNVTSSGNAEKGANEWESLGNSGGKAEQANVCFFFFLFCIFLWFFFFLLHVLSPFLLSFQIFFLN
jgi:hypothetical protein